MADITQCSFLVLADLATALARSAQAAAQVKCDGEHTKYWWRVQPLTDGTAALVIDPSGSYGKIVVTASATGGLTPAEQSALQSYASVQSRIPVPVAPV